METDMKKEQKICEDWDGLKYDVPRRLVGTFGVMLDEAESRPDALTTFHLMFNVYRRQERIFPRYVGRGAPFNYLPPPPWEWFHTDLRLDDKRWPGSVVAG